jgi:thioredoxin reductase
VSVIVRGVPRARAEFRRRVAAAGIAVVEYARIDAILGETQVRGVRLATPAGTVDRPAEAVVIKAGVVPNTEWCRGAVTLDSDGYVIVDRTLRAGAGRVWAVGDVTRPVRLAAAIAVGHGAIAMEAIRTSLGDSTG